jgi:hypothetical protein
LGKKYNIPVDDAPLNWTPPPPKPTPPSPPPLEMKREWVSQLMKTDYNTNNFTRWYGMLPWNDNQRKRMKQTLWEYCVGCWHDGRVVFWQIDHTGKPRAAKLMAFYPEGHPKFGHRDKERNPGWLYNQDGYRQECKPDEHTILKPLFGSHLLKRYPNASVNVVESEKTAIIMANYFGQSEHQIWLACGGLKFLQLDSMQPLIDQGRKVWLWPDKDGVNDWQKVADKLGSENVQVYTKFFDACWEPEDGDKADIADIAVRMLYHPEWVPREIKEKDHLPQVGGTETHCDPLKPNNVTDEEWFEHLDIMKAIGEYKIAHPNDEPFLDAEEIRDPRVHEWRDILRQRYNNNKTRNNGRNKTENDGA